MKNETILITGANGFIGSHLVQELYKDNVVIALDHNENGLHFLPERINCITEIGSIEDEIFVNYVFSKHHPTVVIHCAAYKHIATGEQQPIETINVNIGGTLNIFSAADKYNCKTCIFISTDKADNPISVYGETKRICEKLAKYFSERSSCRYLTIRFCNVYGSTGSVVETFRNKIANGESIFIAEGAKRYFITIEQVVKDILYLYEIGVSGRIYIARTYIEMSIDEVARNIANELGVPFEEISVNYMPCNNYEKLQEDYAIEYGVWPLEI